MMKTENFFWDIYAYVYDLMNYNPPYRKMMSKVVSEVPKDTTKILDAGCGTGNFEKYMFLQNPNVHITAVDISASMYNRAKRKNINQLIKVKKVDLNKKFPFKSNIYDCIVSLNTLYSVEDPQFTISELNRVLKKGGKLILINPNSKANVKNFYKALLNSVSGLNKVIIFLINLPLFVFNVIIKMKAGNLVYHFWNDTRWINLLRANGFINTKSKESYIQGHMITAWKK